MNRPANCTLTSNMAWIAALCLAALGVLLSQNANHPGAVSSAGLARSPHFKQFVALLIGVMLMNGLARLSYDRIRAAAPFLFALSVGLLVLVWVPGVGSPTSEFHRRIGWGALTFQPAELAKLSIVLYYAALFHVKPDRLRTRIGLFGVAAAAIGVFILIEREPDLGTAAVVLLTVLAVLYVAGVSGSRILFSLTVIIVVFGATIWAAQLLGLDYRLTRVLVWMNPEEYADGAGQQTVQGLIAVGASGLFGVGLGNGESKHFVPASHTDYVMATVAEELGAPGVVMVLVLLGVIVYHCFRLALSTRVVFVRLTAVGIGSLIALQSCLNLAVVTNTIPCTGVPMPFVSHGTSSLLIMMAAVGIVVEPFQLKTRAVQIPRPVQS